MIRLYYIQGINRVDTPIFANPSEQERWFFEKGNPCTLDEAYYPPLYDNRIIVTEDDLPLTNSRLRYNYLSLTFDGTNDGKTFYYFIDNIRYVSQGVYEITISMDTIQTYMFDIKMSETFVTRRSLPRWQNATLMKKGYIRENLSTGNFRQVTRRTESDLSFMKDVDELGWVIVHATDTLPLVISTLRDTYKEGFVGTGNIRYLGYQRDYLTDSGGYMYLLPVTSTNKTIKLKFTETLVAEFLPFGEVLKRFSNDSRVNSMSLLPFTPFVGISYESSGNEIIISIEDEKFTYDGKEYTFLNYKPAFPPPTDGDAINPLFLLMCYPDLRGKDRSKVSGDSLYVDLIDKEKRITDCPIAFERNTKTATLFDKRFVPALLDENYMHLTYGIGGDESMVPLQYALSRKCEERLAYGMDNQVHYCVYPISQSIRVGYSEIFPRGNPVSVSLTQFSLYTDPWKDYNVNHQGTRVTDWLNIGLNGASKTATSLGFVAGHAEYGRRYEERNAMQQLNANDRLNAYKERTSVLADTYATGFNTLVKSINEWRLDSEDMFLSLDMVSKMYKKGN